MTELNQDIAEILITEDEIQTKVAELGKRISDDYRGKELLLVGVLKGAFILMADLSRAINIDVEFDFMAVSSYGSSTQTSGIVRIMKDLDLEITGRDVLLVEDVIDALRRLGPVEVSTLPGREEHMEFRLPAELTEGFATRTVSRAS